MSNVVTVRTDDLETLIKSFSHTYLKPEITAVVARLEKALADAKKTVVIAE